MNKCKDCESDDLIQSFQDGIIVCRSCGFVQDQILMVDAEWNSYENDGCQNNDPARCGMPISELLPNNSMVTSIDTSNSYFANKYRNQNWLLDQKERSLKSVYDKMIQCTTNSNIQSYVIDESIKTFKRLTSTQRLCEKNIYKDNLCKRHYNDKNKIEWQIKQIKNDKITEKIKKLKDKLDKIEFRKNNNSNICTAIENNFNRASPRDELIAFCVWYNCRLNNVTSSQEDIMMMFNANICKGRKVFNKLLHYLNDVNDDENVKKCNGNRNNNSNSINVNINIVDITSTTSDLICKYINLLKLPYKIERISQDICKIINKNLSNEITSKCLAAGILYFVIDQYKIDKTIADISSICNVSITTIQKIYRRLMGDYNNYEIILRPNDISINDYYNEVKNKTYEYFENNNYKDGIYYFIDRLMKHPVIEKSDKFKITYNNIFKAFKDKEYDKIKEYIENKYY
jgi:transcription initiation factor TFIIIB Brf1 subunit/transcription initiation factor TFIIB